MDIDLEVLRTVEHENGIPVETLLELLEQALLAAYQRTEGAYEEARAEVDPTTGTVTIWATEFDHHDNYLGEFDDTPAGFDRIAALTVRNVLHQRLREQNDETILGTFRSRTGDMMSGVVQQARDRRMVHIKLGDVEGVLPPHEQVPGEQYTHGTRLRVYITEVSRGVKGPSVTVSRTHPNLVRKLFAHESPEIADGTVEIVALAREAGHRTKMAVTSHRPGVNAKGACIGELGARVRNVMAELGDEKIDIVEYFHRPERFIAQALSPSHVRKVVILDPEDKSARAWVPRDQLSLAIGKEGQNVRLAAKLTGWRIDIVPEEQ